MTRCFFNGLRARQGEYLLDALPRQGCLQDSAVLRQRKKRGEEKTREKGKYDSSPDREGEVTV